jgi:hypothetical protein
MFLPSNCPKMHRFVYCFKKILEMIPQTPFLLGALPPDLRGEGRRRV